MLQWDARRHSLSDHVVSQSQKMKMIMKKVQNSRQVRDGPI